MSYFLDDLAKLKAVEDLVADAVEVVSCVIYQSICYADLVAERSIRKLRRT